MLELEIQEQVSLYVLELMDIRQRVEFEKVLRESAEVRETVLEMQIVIEGMALAIPPIAAPVNSLERIQDRIQSDSEEDNILIFPSQASEAHDLGVPSGVKGPIIKLIVRHAGWVAAACIAMGWFFSSVNTSENSQAGGNVVQTGGSDGESIGESLEDSAVSIAPMEDSLTLDQAVVALEMELQNLGKDFQQSEQNKRDLEEEIRGLNEDGDFLKDWMVQYFRDRSGVKNLMVVNLSDPDGSPGGFLEERAFSDAAAEYLIRDAVDQLNSVGDETALTSVDVGLGADTVESTLNDASRFNTGAESVSTPGLRNPQSPVLDSTFQDASFDDSEFEAPLPPPDSLVDDKVVDPPPEARMDAGIPHPTGVAVYDQNNRTGSLVFQNLPELLPNQEFQLWVFDPQFNPPVDAGGFSIGNQGYGRFDFDLGPFNIFPSQFILTIESAGGVSRPVGPVVLQSPGD